MIVNKADTEEIMSELIRIGRIQCFIVGYIFSGFVLFGESFITLWVGESYRYSYTIAIIIIIPQVFQLSNRYLLQCWKR